jgi:hypothetical protein
MVVDTSVWVDYFNNHSSAHADRLAQAIEEGESIALPGLVYTEILLGLRDDRQADRIASLLDAFDWVAEPGQADYAAAARLYRHCRRKGTPIRPTIDCMIAQLCMRDAEPLLAKDRDFAAIARHASLEMVL